MSRLKEANNNPRRRALEAMLNDYLSEIDNINGLKEVVSHLLEILMQKEREFHLSYDEDNKGNGYYDRNLACLFGNLNLQIPRDRKGNFRPSILPEPYAKADSSFNELVLNLILNSYSPNKIKSLLKSLNLPYSPEQIEELKEDLYKNAREISTKQLPDNVFALFIDAYHTSVKDDDTNQVKKAVIYSIMGIDMSGRKDLYGYYILEGNENREDWLVILNNLIQRGLKRVLLIASDDFSGLDKAIETLFPNSDHQLCFVHLQRNVKRNMSKTDASQFNKKLSSIRLLNDFDKALAQFEQLCEEYKNKYPTFINYILSKKDHYFNFIKYPEEIRKHIYTTNSVENLNSRLEHLRINSGGYFQSTKTAEVSIYVIINKLIKGKWRKPLPAFIACQYEINQMFNLRFLRQTQNFG